VEVFLPTPVFGVIFLGVEFANPIKMPIRNSAFPKFSGSINKQVRAFAKRHTYTAAEHQGFILIQP